MMKASVWRGKRVGDQSKRSIFLKKGTEARGNKAAYETGMGSVGRSEAYGDSSRRKGQRRKLDHQEVAGMPG